jgi:ankyrin repeat protein
MVLRFCFERCNSLLFVRGQTALHLSSEAGQVEACKLLVACQADVNDKDHLCDARPLHTILITKMVLQYWFERCNSLLFVSGQTALHLSSEAGQVEACKLLVACQADVNAQDHGCDARSLHTILITKAVLRFCFELCNSRLLFSGFSALHRSALIGYKKVCKLLVECQADLNLEDIQCDVHPLHTFLKTKAGLRFSLERCNHPLFFQGTDCTAKVFCEVL